MTFMISNKRDTVQNQMVPKHINKSTGTRFSMKIYDQVVITTPGRDYLLSGQY